MNIKGVGIRATTEGAEVIFRTEEAGGPGVFLPWPQLEPWKRELELAINLVGREAAAPDGKRILEPAAHSEQILKVNSALFSPHLGGVKLTVVTPAGQIVVLLTLAHARTLAQLFASVLAWREKNAHILTPPALSELVNRRIRMLAREPQARLTRGHADTAEEA